VQDFCVYMEVFENGSANAANRILPRLTLVATETKFGIKMGYNSTCVRDISKILASNKGF